MYVGIRGCYGKENEERVGGLNLMGCILDRLIRCIRCASSVRRPSAQSAPPSARFDLLMFLAFDI